MNDDLKFKNIPSAELEKLSQELEEKNKLDENVSAQTEHLTENFINLENNHSEDFKTQSVEPEALDVPIVEEPKEEVYAAQSTDDETVDVENTQTETFNKVQQYPQNTSSNKPPQTNTLRNKNAYQQNEYQYPPSATVNNQYSRTNTVRNSYPTNNYNNTYSFNSYPQNNSNNSYSQNGYQYPQNSGSNNQYSRANTVRNRNGYPHNNYNSYSTNGYQYPPNMNYPQNRQQYPQQANKTYAQVPYNPSPGYAPPNQPYYYYEPSPKELEKLALSKDVSTAGKTTIAIYIVMFIVAIIIEFIAVFCGVSNNVPDLADDPYAGFTPMGFYMYEGLTSLLSVFLPALIIIKSSGLKITKLMPFKKIEGKKLLSIVMCGMSLCMVAQLMATLIGINLGLFGIDIYKGLETATATGFFDLIMSSICTAIIPALVEEFAYRGLVAGILKEHDEMLAVFGSAFLFGMLHGNFGQIPFAFVVGLILGYVRVKTDSMLPGILIHFGNNFYAVVITILGEILPEPYASIVDAAVILVLIVIGFISTSYLIKKHKDLFKVEKKQSYLTYKEKLSIFLKSGTVIASIIILTITSLVVLLVV